MTYQMWINLKQSLRHTASIIKSVVLDLGHEERYLSVQKLYRIIILSWFFLHTAILVPYHSQIWGPAAYVENMPFEAGAILSWITEVLLHPAVAPYYLIFVVGQLISLSLGICGVAPRFILPIIWFFTQNLNAKSAVIMDGGNNLSELLLFYLLFINTSGIPISMSRSGTLRSFFVGVSNAAFFLSRFQIFVVYLTVGLYKLNGDLWQNGMALYYILQSKEYTHPLLGGFLVDHPLLSMLGTYFTVAFQSMFPYLVWFDRTRPWMLMMGTVLHLGIAFVMGLFTFGLIMCASYFVFFKESWSRAVLSTVKGLVGSSSFWRDRVSLRSSG